jgi:hypothetical protein
MFCGVYIGNLMEDMYEPKIKRIKKFALLNILRLGDCTYCFNYHFTYYHCVDQRIWW